MEHFTDTQRFNITNKINHTVLGEQQSICAAFSGISLQEKNSILFFTFPACFADEELPLDTDGAEILSETFNVLSLKEMKLQAMTSTAGGVAGEEPEDEERMATMAKAVLQAAQKKVVSQVS